MKALLMKIQELQLELLDFDNYSLSVSSSGDYISANLHNKINNQSIVASLGFVHKDYIDDSEKAINEFIDKVMTELINN